MSEIRAFVGHSFADDDGELIAKFTKQLSQIASLNQNFSWTHAESAEPKDVGDKVLDLIEDKDLFIGICTRKEQTIESGLLSPLKFQWGRVAAKETDFAWKTSDWIIQEIGLAIGRGLYVILLIEEGVRQPGGLQGNIERIYFSREYPEKCFGKLMEMIASLVPKGITTSASEIATTAPNEVKKAEEKGGDQDWIPKPDWTQMHYESAGMRMIVIGDTAGLDRISTAYKDFLGAEQPDKVASWDAYLEYQRVFFGKNGSFDKLKSLAEANPANSEVISYLAEGYDEYDDHAAAARCFEQAAEHAPDEKNIVQLMGRAALQYAKDGSIIRAIEIVEKIKPIASKTNETQVSLLRSMRLLAQTLHDDDLELAAMEKILELHPEDTNTRFELAYKHSQCENEDMSLHHYLKIPYQDRNANGWNNLGVSFDHFNMPTKGVNAFQRAARQNSTLAMSNLGFKFLRAGFAKEAKEECDKGLGIEGYHKNIAQLLTQIQERSEEEEEKQKEVLEKLKPKAEFYRRLGLAAAMQTPTNVHENWAGQDGNLKLQMNGRSVRIFGSFDKPENSLGRLFAIGISTPTASRMVRHRIEYSGQLQGHMIKGEVSRSHDGQPKTLLEEAMSTLKVLMYFDDTQAKIFVLENPHSVSPSFYSFQKGAVTK